MYLSGPFTVGNKLYNLAIFVVSWPFFSRKKFKKKSFQLVVHIFFVTFGKIQGTYPSYPSWKESSERDCTNWHKREICVIKTKKLFFLYFCVRKMQRKSRNLFVNFQTFDDFILCIRFNSTIKILIFLCFTLFKFFFMLHFFFHFSYLVETQPRLTKERAFVLGMFFS